VGGPTGVKSVAGVGVGDVAVTLADVRVSKRVTSAVLLAGLFFATYAAAAAPGPLSGIGAAVGPQTSADLLPQQLLTNLRVPLMPQSSRLLRTLPGGRKVYVAESTPNRLAVVIVTPGRRPGHVGTTLVTMPPLTTARPTTVTAFTTEGANGGKVVTTSLAFGVAQDGITSVSFKANGHLQTVPVIGNVWFSSEPPFVRIPSITVHFANGRTQTIRR
jgi:hypothetical protein